MTALFWLSLVYPVCIDIILILSYHVMTTDQPIYIQVLLLISQEQMASHCETSQQVRSEINVSQWELPSFIVLVLVFQGYIGQSYILGVWGCICTVCMQVNIYNFSLMLFSANWKPAVLFVTYSTNRLVVRLLDKITLNF